MISKKTVYLVYRYNFLFLYLWIHIMYHFIQNRLTLVLEYVHVRHCLIATDHKCVNLTIQSRVHSFFARQALGDGCITTRLINMWSSYGIWFGNSKWVLTTRNRIYKRIIVPEYVHLRISKKKELTYLVLGQKHLKKEISCHGTW